MRQVIDPLVSLLLTAVVMLAGCVLGTLFAPILWPLSRLGVFRWLTRMLLAVRPGVLRGDIVGRITPGSWVLDIGAGDGSLARAIALERRAEVVGTDIQDRKPVGVKLVVTDGILLPFPDRSFDFVVLSYVLHHSPTPELVLRECGRVCRGQVIAVEDQPFFGRRFYQWGHHRFFNPLIPVQGMTAYRYPQEWRDLFQGNGLRIVHERSRWGILSTPLKRQLFVLVPQDQT